jgi:arylsulfatase A-like enzyme
MRFLDDKGLWSKTVLAVLADHGEALGEHGMFAHAQALYEEQVAVPLVVRSPGSIARRFPDPLTITALPEIVLRALGGRWPVAHSMPPKDDSAAVAVQEMNIGRHLAWRSLRTRRWAYHNRQMEGTTSLYDVVADPGELDDRAADEPARLAEFRALEERFESWEAQTVSGVDGLPRSARPTSPR